MPKSDRNKIRKNKEESSIDWKEEIRNILDGKREKYLLKIGSVRGYIESLAKASGISDYKEHFDPALKEIVRSWDVHVPREKEYFIVMLELITSYTPEGGARKVREFHEYWESSISEIEDKFGYDSNSNLQLRIIETLGAYYNLAPEANSCEEDKSGFRYYVDLLNKYISVPEIAGDIALILLENFIAEISDKKIRKAIRKEPESIYNITSYIFSVDRSHTLEEDLESLAHQVYEVGGKAIDIFENRLKVYDADFVYGQLNLTIYLSNGEEIVIEFSGKAFEHFLMRKLELHLLPKYVDELFNRRVKVKDNHSKIQDILNNCYNEGEESVLQFRKILNGIDNLILDPDPFSTLRIWLKMNETSVALICQKRYPEAWSDSHTKEDFINNLKPKEQAAYN